MIQFDLLDLSIRRLKHDGASLTRDIMTLQMELQQIMKGNAIRFLTIEYKPLNLWHIVFQIIILVLKFWIRSTSEVFLSRSSCTLTLSVKLHITYCFPLAVVYLICFCYIPLIPTVTILASIAFECLGLSYY